MMTKIQSSLHSLHRMFWSISRPMTLLFWAMVLTSILGLIGVLLDPRLVLGQSTWAKTTKFSLSIVLYAGSMLWVFGYDSLRPRLSRFILATGAWILGLEMILIILQGSRAVPMHFNNATPFDATLFSIMGATITLFWFINALGVAVLLAQQVPSPVLAWGLRLGFVIALLGMLEGFLMTGPTPDQMALLEAGQHAPMLGAHTVGAPDGGAGLPLLGWSTTHGDLRIGHFVGLHALQIVPLLGLLLMRRRESWLATGHRLALLWTGALGYLGVTALVTWQALRAQPLFAPDALTIAAFALLAGAMNISTVAILLYARRQNRGVRVGTMPVTQM
ncbi:MAG: hypothetical protein KDE19_14540 [Caldilineaceae bacterium]|nr:hypothetical protein [Caldilineaceae bacterium]